MVGEKGGGVRYGGGERGRGEIWWGGKGGGVRYGGGKRGRGEIW